MKAQWTCYWLKKHLPFQKVGGTRWHTGWCRWQVVSSKISSPVPKVTNSNESYNTCILLYGAKQMLLVKTSDDIIFYSVLGCAYQENYLCCQIPDSIFCKLAHIFWGGACRHWPSEIWRLATRWEESWLGWDPPSHQQSQLARVVRPVNQKR